MKNSKKLSRKEQKMINGGGSCPMPCPAGPYGPGYPKSCAQYEALPDCCKSKVLVSYECFPQ